jgi:hypothetical protein
MTTISNEAVEAIPETEDGIPVWQVLLASPVLIFMLFTMGKTGAVWDALGIVNTVGVLAALRYWQLPTGDAFKFIMFGSIGFNIASLAAWTGHLVGCG